MDKNRLNPGAVVSTENMPDAECPECGPTYSDPQGKCVWCECDALRFDDNDELNIRWFQYQRCIKEQS